MADLSPKDIQALLAEGWVYVDVRTEEEYGLGHPPGSLNVPLILTKGSARVPNEDFLAAMEALFEKDSKLIVACASGGRTARAGQQLSGAGFTAVKLFIGGWDGARDGAGNITAPGWVDAGLPSERGQPEDRSWRGLLERLEG